MTQVRLTEAQRVMLATAMQRDDGSLLPLPEHDLPNDKRTQTLSSLERRRLAQSFEVSDPAAKWRMDGETMLGLRITAAGLALIGIADEAAATNAATSVVVEQRPDAAPEDSAALQAASTNAVTPTPTPMPTPTPTQPVARQTKREQLIALLSRAEGATISQLVTALGWLPHTTRAALTGLRKAGHAVVSDKVGSDRIYRIEGAA